MDKPSYISDWHTASFTAAGLRCAENQTSSASDPGECKRERKFMGFVKIIGCCPPRLILVWDREINDRKRTLTTTIDHKVLWKLQAHSALWVWSEWLQRPISILCYHIGKNLKFYNHPAKLPWLTAKTSAVLSYSPPPLNQLQFA